MRARGACSRRPWSDAEVREHVLGMQRRAPQCSVRRAWPAAFLPGGGSGAPRFAFNAGWLSAGARVA
eukprot:12305798-Alexandrium_andersonii.AAC.1